jgi:hypothetical protein
VTKTSQNQKFDILRIVLSLAISMAGTEAFAAKKTGKKTATKAKVQATLINTSPIQQIDALNELNTGSDENSKKSLKDSSIFEIKTASYDKYLASSSAVASVPAPAVSTQTTTARKDFLPKPAEKAWSITLGADHFIPQREERDQLTVSSFGAGYLISRYLETSWKLEAGLDYAHVWAKYDDPGNSQIDEIRASLTRAQKFGKYGLNMSLGVLLPANEFDSKAGFNGAISASVGGSLNMGMVLLATSIKPTFFSYKFDTPEVASEIFNKRTSVEGNLIFGLSFTDELSWTNLARLTENWNIAGTQTQTYLLSTSLSYQATKNIGVSAGVLSSDRVMTTNEAFSENVNTIRIGMEIGI